MRNNGASGPGPFGYLFIGLCKFYMRCRGAALDCVVTSIMKAYIDPRIGEHHTRNSAHSKQKDKAYGEQHGCGEYYTPRPHSSNPTNAGVLPAEPVVPELSSQLFIFVKLGDRAR